MPEINFRVPAYDWTRDFQTRCACGEFISLSVPYSPGGSGYQQCRCGRRHSLNRLVSDPRRLEYHVTDGKDRHDA